MKKNLKIILSAVLLVAIVAGSSVLYQKLTADYSGSGNLITDSNAINAQLGQQNQSNNAEKPSGNTTPPPLTESEPKPEADSENTSPPENTEGSENTEAPENNESNGNTENSDNSENTENNAPADPPDENGQEENEGNTPPSDPPKNLAPDFTVLDEDGNEVKLSDFRGKPVVLNFWATWCYYCKVEMPDFNEAYKKYPEIQFLMVNATATSGESEANARKFKADNGYDFEIFFDTERDAIDTYNITGYPTTYFISAEGEIIAIGRGMLNMANLEYGVSLILPAKKED